MMIKLTSKKSGAPVYLRASAINGIGVEDGVGIVYVAGDSVPYQVKEDQETVKLLVESVESKALRDTNTRHRKINRR